MRSEDDQFKSLAAENKRLKIAFADATLARMLLETLVEEVDKHCQTDVKKNFGQKLSAAAGKKKRKRRSHVRLFRIQSDSVLQERTTRRKEAVSREMMLELIGTIGAAYSTSIGRQKIVSYASFGYTPYGCQYGQRQVL